MTIIKHIPNTITSMNLFCGILGVIFTFGDHLDYAFLLMIAAAVFDFFDGLAARMLNAYSEMGKELDSLADMVSFGVLPSLMLHKLMLSADIDGILSYVPLLIAVFSALRLAKFNTDSRQSENFIGLPTPACAMLCGAFAYYVCVEPSSILYRWASNPFFIPVCSVVLSFLLVSEIPMFSMKFKKGMGTAGTVVHTLRCAFGGVIFVSSIITLLVGLNWSFIFLLMFSSYIIMNLIARKSYSRKSEKK